MLCVVENKHLTRGRFRGNDTRVLRHEACPVHLSVVVDLDLNLDLAAHRPKSTKFYTAPPIHSLDRDRQSIQATEKESSNAS